MAGSFAKGKRTIASGGLALGVTLVATTGRVRKFTVEASGRAGWSTVVTSTSGLAYKSSVQCRHRPRT